MTIAEAVRRLQDAMGGGGSGGSGSGIINNNNNNSTNPFVGGDGGVSGTSTPSGAARSNNSGDGNSTAFFSPRDFNDRSVLGGGMETERDDGSTSIELEHLGGDAATSSSSSTPIFGHKNSKIATWLKKRIGMV